MFFSKTSFVQNHPASWTSDVFVSIWYGNRTSYKLLLPYHS